MSTDVYQIEAVSPASFMMIFDGTFDGYHDRGNYDTNLKNYTDTKDIRSARQFVCDPK